MEVQKVKPDYHVVSFSGGKDSTAMLLRMLELGMQVDEILFCDMTVEFPAMYDHLKKVEEYTGRKITILRDEHDYEYYLLKHHPKKKTAGRPRKGNGFPRPDLRWCTGIKQKLISKHLKQLKKKYNVIQYIGIAADEQNRVKDKTYPLVDWGWTEKDCLEYCYSKGFDWDGLYKIFHRVSCWCCPLQPIDELRKLRKHFPDLWNKLMWWQTQTWSKFMHKTKVKKLEVRFAYEDEIGATPRTKEFFAEVERRYRHPKKHERVKICTQPS